MDQRNISIVVGILLLTGALIWIVTTDVEYTFPDEADITAVQEPIPWWAYLVAWQGDQQRSIRVHQGLDLQGGLQVVMEADLPEGQELSEGAMEAARIVVDNRVNGRG
jgi:preprotein translocase subunit SecD